MTSSTVITTRMARELKLVQLTEAMSPTFSIRTIGGYIPWLTWCQNEVRRLQQKARKAYVVRHVSGNLSVGADTLVDGTEMQFEPGQYYKPEHGR